jgi:hypothetical protein
VCVCVCVLQRQRDETQRLADETERAKRRVSHAARFEKEMKHADVSQTQAALAAHRAEVAGYN